MRAALFALALLLRVPVASGAEPAGGDSVGALAKSDARAHRVALFPVQGNAPLGSRLAAELLSQGFQLSHAEALESGGVSFEALSSAMQRAGADLAICIVVEPTSLELWIVNAVTGKRLYRETPLTAGTQPDSAIVSLWAVEALRASELAAAPSAPPVPSHRDSAPKPKPRTERRLLSLDVAPGVLLSPGGVGASTHLTVGARLRLTRQLGLEWSLVSPTLPTRLERASGNARVWRALSTLGAFLTTRDAASSPALDVAAGGALIGTRVDGSAAAGFVGRAEQLFSIGPFARTGASLPLSSRCRLRLDAASGLAFPRPLLLFDDERVAVWGRPWFLLSLGAEATF